MMTCSTVVLLAIVAQTSSSAGLERQTVELLRASAGEYAVECEYEVSTYQDPKYAKPPPRRDDGLVELNLARILYQTDHAYKEESVYKNLKRESEASIWRTADGSKLYDYEKDRDGKYGAGTISPGSGSERLNGSFFKVFPLPRLIEDLKSPYAEASWIGNEILEGCPCRILKIRHYKNQPSDKGATSVAWIDLSKNGLVLRLDYYHGTQLVRQMIVDKFQRFTGQGEILWLPIDAHDHGYLAVDSNMKSVCLQTPVSRTLFQLTASSVRLYPKVDASRFAMTFPRGTMVRDLIRKKSYEVGQDRRPPPKSNAETRKRLTEYLAQADVQSKEVRAPSLERGDGGPSIVTILSWLLGGMSVATLGFLLVRRMRRG